MAGQLNFSFFPVPDCDWPDGDPTTCDTQAFGKGPCACDRVEACAAHVSGCLYGCSGSKLTTLAAFLGCFAGKKEGTCSPAPQESCASAAGLDQNALSACMRDKSVLDTVFRAIWTHGKHVQSFPDMNVNGEKAHGSTDSAKGLLKIFCTAGATAAC